MTTSDFFAGREEDGCSTILPASPTAVREEGREGTLTNFEFLAGSEEEAFPFDRGTIDRTAVLEKEKKCYAHLIYTIKKNIYILCWSFQE